MLELGLNMIKQTDSHKNSKPRQEDQFSNFHTWIPLVILIVCGGLIGYLLGFLLPPIYETKAVVTTNIDLVENRPVVTEIMVDSQLNYIGELMYNPRIIEPLLQQEVSYGNPITIEDLKSMATIERQLMSTIIKVRGSNPEIAARIATNWAKLAYETLLAARPHVLAATQARQELALIEVCYPTNSAANESTSSGEDSFCEGLSYKSANTKLEEATKVLASEEPKTLGLTAYIIPSQYIPASLPLAPASNNQGMMAFSGMIIGIVVGIIFVELARLKKTNET